MLVLLALACRTPAPDPVAAPAARPCAECHPAEQASWTGSRHALAEREVGPEDTWATELGAVRRIGVSPVVQALVPAEGGRLQAHSDAYDPRDGTRFPLFDDGRVAGEWGHWTGGGNTWNSQCAACHTTGFRKGLQDDGTYASTFDALGVTCAACHGDASAHASGGPPPVNGRMEDTCAACHMLRAELGPPMAPGDALLDHMAPTLVDHPSFGPDGRALGETFEHNQFAASGMHTGGARCGDCHDPHSGALREGGDALCGRCHDALGPPAAHGAHTPVLACVECHMPTTTVMQRHARRDHGFTTPRQGAASDACAACHPEHPSPAAELPAVEGVAAARAGTSWRGLDFSDPSPDRRAANLSLLGGFAEDFVARDLLRTASTDGSAIVRYAVAGALVPHGREDLDVLERLAKDPVRAVRVAAQRALVEVGLPLDQAPDYRAMLDHNADHPTSRAERGMRRLDAGDPRGLGDLAAASAMDPGNADLIVLRAVALSGAGRASDALRILEAAGRPDHAGVQQALGLALADAGRADDAMAALRRAVEVDPSRGVAWRNLALLLARAGRADEARQAAARAVAALPDDTELAEWAATL